MLKKELKWSLASAPLMLGSPGHSTMDRGFGEEDDVTGALKEIQTDQKPSKMSSKSKCPRPQRVSGW